MFHVLSPKLHAASTTFLGDDSLLSDGVDGRCRDASEGDGGPFFVAARKSLSARRKSVIFSNTTPASTGKSMWVFSNWAKSSINRQFIVF